MNDERGQAALFAVVLIAIAVGAMAGLRAAEQRIFTANASRNAGEAAVEAATVVVADAYASELRARAADPARPRRGMRAVLGEASLGARARSSADEASVRNGGAVLDGLTIACDRAGVAVSAVIRGTTFRAGFAGGECSQP